MLSARRPAAALFLAMLAGCGEAGQGGADGDESLGENAAALTCVTIARGLPGATVTDAAVLVDPLDPTRSVANYGALLALPAGELGPTTYQGLLRFELGVIPAGATLVSATLELTSAASLGAPTVSLHRVTAPWSELSVSGSSFAGAFDPVAAASFPSGGPGASLTIDVLPLVAPWVSGAQPNHGVLLAAGPGRVVFRSSEVPSAAERPELSVCYLVASCNDGLQNGTETGLDCGGGACAPCGNGAGCLVPGDCQSGVCSGGACQCVDTVNLPVHTTAPALLSQTGLYANTATKTLAPYVQAFSPKYPLWSDASAKNRWAYVPMCATIDTTNMDSWSFPVGTRFWKEFIVAGKLVETRLLERFGPGVNDWIYAPYRWNGAGTDASYVQGGASNVNGTQHDIPSVLQCLNCHRLNARALGFEVVNLSHSGAGVTMATLSAAGVLSTPLPGGYAVPGTPTEEAALGYLHTNCGPCHNAASPSFVYNARLGVAHTLVQQTPTFLTTVGVVSPYVVPGMTHIIEPGDPATSVLSHRMGQRGNLDQMPPIGSEVVDAAGKAAVDAWILGLP
jgi:hypothetical protein